MKYSFNSPRMMRMQNKFWNIARRECAVRMNKPAFWILSLMGPVVLVILSVVPYAITSSLQDKKTILVNVPETMQHRFPLSIVNYEVQLIDTTNLGALSVFLSGSSPVLCDLKTGRDPLWTISTKETLHPLDSLNILRTLSGINPSVAEVPAYLVSFKTEATEDELSFSPLQQTVALLAAILVYFFLFTYSVSLLKGVMEEKSGKVMDIILSSVSPVTWIMGKIAGVGLASFVQFILWIGISYAPFYFFKQKYGGALNSFSAENIHASLLHTQQAQIGQAMGWYDWLSMMDNIHWITLLITMMAAMLFGFILYSAVFAIIGMISGRESDAQPYVLPVTSPLIFSFITSGAVIADPYGSLSHWLSIVPFTAPVALTLRAGLGVAFSDLWMNLFSLGLASAVAVVFAGRLYKKVLNTGGYLFWWKK
ncbi:MAG: ABC transporter permease [Cytophagaceae bacterium]|nr:ABC transporter permease [Cytophagaceae bacterium]